MPSRASFMVISVFTDRCRPAMRRVWRLCRRPDVFRSEFNRRHYHHGPYTKMSNAERVALEKATAACKAEAKGMKFRWHWRKRQKYVKNCIISARKEQTISGGDFIGSIPFVSPRNRFGLAYEKSRGGASKLVVDGSIPALTGEPRCQGLNDLAALQIILLNCP